MLSKTHTLPEFVLGGAKKSVPCLSNAMLCGPSIDAPSDPQMGSRVVLAYLFRKELFGSSEAYTIVGVEGGAEAVVEPVGAAEACAARAMRAGIENSMLNILY